MNTKSINPLKIEGKVGDSVDIDEVASNLGLITTDDKIEKYLKERKKKRKIKSPFSDKKIRSALKAKNIYDAKKQIDLIKYPKKLTEWASRVPNNVVVEIKGRRLKFFKKNYSDTDREIDLIGLNPYEKNSEFADLSGLYEDFAPNSTWVGNKLYVINGKLVSAWALYYGMNSIKSPEDYAKNVDMVYNVPYVFSSFELKAQMGLGAKMLINDRLSEDSDREKYIRWLLKHRLKVDTRFRKKVSFHKSEYGNCYIHIHNDKDGIPDKLTILQPERIKVYLDPLTTKILFYVYLPPILGGSILPAYPHVRGSAGMTSGLMSAPMLRFPTPIVIPVRNMMHFKTHDYTEYPFGFSELRSATEVCQARFDINLLAPYYFKKYCKATTHWKYGDERTLGKNLNKKLTEMKGELEDLEPGSDVITSAAWESKVLGPATGQSEIFALTNDLDMQMFAVTGVPETYFKPKGTTDRLVSNEDKTFIGKLKQDQDEFSEMFFRKIIKKAIDIKFGPPKKPTFESASGASQRPDNITTGAIAPGGITALDVQKDPVFKDDEEDMTYEEWEASDYYPQIEFEDITKIDKTQEISNTLALLNAELIDKDRAAKRVGELPPSQNEQLQKEIKDKIQKEIMSKYNPSDYTRMNGGLDMDKEERDSQLMNPEGKFKKAPNKVSGKTETADMIIIDGKKIPIIKK